MTAQMPWFRFYEEVLDDPKVQKLAPEDFKTWVNVLCLASRHRGRLPALADIAFALRMEPHACSTVLSRLSDAGLLDTLQGGAHGSHHAPHAWNKRQYKSDTSTERVQRFRKRSETVPETADGTPPDTDSETEKKELKQQPQNPGLEAAAAAKKMDRVDIDRTERLVQPRPIGSNLDALRDKLTEAARPGIWPLATCISLAPIPALLAEGCDLDLDVIPAVASLADAARHNPKPKRITTWAYFADAILQARDERLAGRRKPGNDHAPPAPSDPAKLWPLRAKLYTSNHRQWDDNWGVPRAVVPPAYRELFPGLFDEQMQGVEA